MSYRYAKALKSNGIEKGQEFVCCIENTPEFPYIMGAASAVGAVVNLISAEFNDDYLSEIIDNADFPFIFVSDMSFSQLTPALLKLKKSKTIVPLPIEYSLTNGNPYRAITERYYTLDTEAYKEALAQLDNILDIDSFLASGESYSGKVAENADLDDPFTITYTSGSTNWDRPKGLIHKVRAYTTSARFQDADTSKQASMSQHVCLALVKTMSDTNFMSNISDKLMHDATVALEPIICPDIFLQSMLMNKPSLVMASTSSWLHAMKQQKRNKRFEDIHLKHLLCAVAIGEPMSAGEERALNRWLRKMGIGRDHLPIPIACMSVGGGTSEQGGIFFRIFRALASKSPRNIGMKEPIGMKAYGMVQATALREDGSHCSPLEKGHLVAKSPCMMLGYVNNPEAEAEYFVTDVYGKVWGSLGTYGYIDKQENVYVKGRISEDGLEPPNYEIEDVVLRDFKNIMSCSVISLKDEKDTRIAHIMLQEKSGLNTEKILRSSSKRLAKLFGEELLNRLYYRVRAEDEPFELLHTGKRSVFALQDEGLSERCVEAWKYYT